MTVLSPSQIKFDKDYLNDLLTQPGSGVFRENCQYHIALHPAQLNDFALSVKGELSKKIARYDESFKGILLGFENLKLLSQMGTIGVDNCYIHLDVDASFFVFRPEIGMNLKGTVTQVSKDHVGCLVYHTFNISLPKPLDDDGSWLGAHVATGNEVEFQISLVNLQSRLPYICGELRSILLSIEDRALAEEEPTQSQKSPKEKRKHKKDKSKQKESNLSVAESLQIKNDDSFSAEVPKKKKKSKLKKEQDFDVSLDSLDLNTLFSNSDVNFDNFSGTPDIKTKRRRSQSVSHEQELKLEPDSDLEKIINSTRKERKRSKSVSSK